MRTDPRTDELPPGSDVRQLSEDFDGTYGELLAQLEVVLTGAPARLTEAVGTMWTLRWQAEALLRIPVGAGSETVGPAFSPAG